jgi:hypothetical protein
MAIYPQFEGLLRAKLEIDGEAIGGERERVWYGFGRLAGEAAGRIYPWIGYAQKEGKFTVKGLFEQMKIAFRDPRQRQKALGQLNRTKQGSQPLNEFLNEFNRLILEAEGWGWDDVIKKGYLKAALSSKLILSTVGMKEEESYDEYCSQLRMVSDQLAEVKDLTARRTGWWKEKARSPSPPRTTAPLESMDWEPTPRIAGHRTIKEPRWAPPEEVERRKREGLCLRCGKDGHFVGQCRAKLRTTSPARQDKPRSDQSKKKDVRIAATIAKKTKKTEAVVEELSDTDADSSSYDSGKE